MDIIGSAERRERQRFHHLVLEKPRPKSAAAKSDRAARRRKSMRANPVELEAGIEEIVQMREKWSHKTHGTPQTHEHAERYQEGSLKRLYLSGAINAEQLAASVDIATVFERIGADVTVKTADLEPRIKSGRHGDAFFEQLHQVRHEMAYTRWRKAMPGPIAPVLEMICGDMPLTAVARHYRMHNRRAKQLLIDALDLWAAALGATCREVDEATLLAAQAGFLS